MDGTMNLDSKYVTIQRKQGPHNYNPPEISTVIHFDHTFVLLSSPKFWKWHNNIHFTQRAGKS